MECYPQKFDTRHLGTLRTTTESLVKSLTHPIVLQTPRGGEVGLVDPRYEHAHKYTLSIHPSIYLRKETFFPPEL